MVVTVSTTTTTTTTTATSGGFVEIVKLLLSSNIGANINHENNKGQTPLLIALTNGHQEVVECLIENGANVNLGSTPPLCWGKCSVV